MKQIHAYVVTLLGITVVPIVSLAADTKEEPVVPSCAQPLGTLLVQSISCETSKCKTGAAGPHRGFGIGGFAMKAMDSKKLAVTPAALERSGEDLTRMLHKAFGKTGCFNETVSDENAKSDFRISGKIVELEVKSTKNLFGRSTGQAVKLGIDVQLSRTGQPDSENISFGSNSEKPTIHVRHHAQLFHTQEEATALDLAMADATIQAVNEATKRFAGVAATPPAPGEK